MRILGVLDLMAGVVVHGVGGRRSDYRPIASPLCPTPGPLDVALAYRRAYGIDELYLADLDALAGAEPAWGVYESLRSRGFDVWVDAGVRTAADGLALARAGVGVVAGLETLAGPHVLAELAGVRSAFSLDLRAGVPLTGGDAWRAAAEAIEAGARRVLVLDLARVGGGAGTGTEDLCARLAAAYPGVEVWAGGGVRGREDLDRLRDAGVRAVLAATALHWRSL